MANIDFSKYYRAKPYIDSSNGKENQQYYWVQKRDESTKYSIKENIYDVENDKFILDEWVDMAGRGLMHDNIVNVGLLVDKPENNKRRIYNQFNVKDGKLLFFKWLTADEWIKNYKKNK